MADRAAQIAEELYALAPDEFTAARDRAVKAARDDGDRDLAATVKQFRRPSIGAWLVNTIARTEQLDDLLDLGAALREAQEALDGSELRAMSRQRHQVIRALSDLAHNRAGRNVGDAAQREFEATLEAALSDEAAANAVRTGRLMRPLTSTGLEPVDLTDAVAAPDEGPPARRKAKKKPANKQDDGAAKKRVAQAEQALEAAQHDLDSSAQAADQARTAVDEARRRTAALEADLERARAEQSDAERARRDAEAAVKAAARARDAAERALQTARKGE
jgi:hypothetical protein